MVKHVEPYVVKLPIEFFILNLWYFKWSEERLFTSEDEDYVTTGMLNFNYRLFGVLKHYRKEVCEGIIKMLSPQVVGTLLSLLS